ncbi:MAG TPA: hypothetical protein VNL71_07715 [Chloroflexota bacterium]|nr:hypothetical protein [Chloroflexota bacterium]
MTTAAHAIASVADQMSFFAAHVSGHYGIFPISFADGEIVPGTPTDWASALPNVFASVEATA